MSEIKPCPFCNGEASLSFCSDIEGTLFDQIGCDDCGAVGPYATTPEIATKFWNRRANERD
jgi:Lar family restriction alleviation protein